MRGKVLELIAKRAALPLATINNAYNRAIVKPYCKAQKAVAASVAEFG
ncbi:hypothetical protein [Alteraurantiacibacter aquimixticola]|nr:hypothetical protein [Alteraurantiacibacter aquimixticola]